MEDVVPVEMIAEDTLEESQPWSTIRMDCLEHQGQPHGREVSHRRFTGVQVPNTEEVTPTDSAGSMMESFGKSLKNVSSRVTSTFMVNMKT